MLNDESIIKMYFARNEQAIEETDKKYGSLCFYLANNILSDTEDSQECLNDAYLAVWNSIPPEYPDQFRAYILKIVRNLAMKKFRYILADKRSRDVTVSYCELEEILPGSDRVQDFEYIELGHILSEFLRKEKEDSRNVFIRKYYFFDSIKDISAQYGFTESRIKSLLYHSRIRLKNYLRKEGIEI